MTITAEIFRENFGHTWLTTHDLHVILAEVPQTNFRLILCQISLTQPPIQITC